MATLLELHNLYNDSDLMTKVQAAVVKAGTALLEQTPIATSDEAAWAAAAVGNSTRQAQAMLRAVLAANDDKTVAQIQSATDAAIQANVDAMVPALVLAYAAERAAGGA